MIRRKSVTRGSGAAGVGSTGVVFGSEVSADALTLGSWLPVTCDETRVTVS
ncbi:MAG TPA: hypothetical protein VHP33_13640 [Polyangiaceae bacterium]|nr:hypothetical protein [Polyangiaceae bacterium]